MVYWTNLREGTRFSLQNVKNPDPAGVGGIGVRDFFFRFVLSSDKLCAALPDEIQRSEQNSVNPD
jgi:hypothetical protein